MGSDPGQAVCFRLAKIGLSRFARMRAGEDEGPGTAINPGKAD
jgi:hypothetical protein